MMPAPMPQQAPPTYTLPAPWKGLNTIDAVAEMDPNYAIACTNFIATPGGLSLRQGYNVWATGLPTSVSSLLVYNGRVATANKLFAVSGTAIYDVTSGGAVGAAVVSGLSSSSVYWQSAAMTYSTGNSNYLMCVNGTDLPRLYNGTWTTCSQPTTPSAPGQFNQNDNNGNPVNIATFVDIVCHQQRLWFVSLNSTIAYYAPIAAAGGQLAAFDFGPLFPRGGYLFKLASWTMDTGNGIAAVLVGISSKGDIAVFQGNNPASATTWGLTGQYSVGSPVGRRCTTQMEGDLFYLTVDGLYAMSKYVQSSRVDAKSALTYQISPTISNLTASLINTPGFEMCVYPAGSLMLLNIPQSSQANNFQFCYQTTNMAWSQFTGWPAQCFQLFNDQLFFGGIGQVCLAFQGYNDGANQAGVGGNNIIASALSAFTTFNIPGLKTVSLVKPYIVTGQSSPTVRVGINSDFTFPTVTGAVTLNPSSGAVWDSGIWDSSLWAGSLTTFNQWSDVLMFPGEYVAMALSISAVSTTQWMSTNFMVQPAAAYG